MTTTAQFPNAALSILSSDCDRPDNNTAKAAAAIFLVAVTVTALLYYLSPMRLTRVLVATIVATEKTYLEALETGLLSASDVHTAEMLSTLELKASAIREETLRNSLSLGSTLREFFAGRTFTLLRCIREVHELETHIERLEAASSAHTLSFRQTTSENLIADKPESQVAMDLTNTYWKTYFFFQFHSVVFDPKQTIGRKFKDSSGCPDTLQRSRKNVLWPLDQVYLETGLRFAPESTQSFDNVGDSREASRAMEKKKLFKSLYQSVGPGSASKDKRISRKGSCACVSQVFSTASEGLENNDSDATVAVTKEIQPRYVTEGRGRSRSRVVRNRRTRYRRFEPQAAQFNWLMNYAPMTSLIWESRRYYIAAIPIDPAMIVRGFKLNKKQEQSKAVSKDHELIQTANQ
ncbi:hypothetical protein B0H13DRAFT_2511001 [Mycena leptocephala]|nr:hypothetical protein B0H13DRAFT_2511001 [Mycena leptocephala]